MSTQLRNAPSILKTAVVLIYILVVMAVTGASSGSPVNIDLTDETMMMTMKISQMIGVFILFVGPAFLFAHLLFEGRTRDLALNRKPTMQFIIASVLLILLAQPLISWLGHLNNSISLPGFMKETEAWMRSSEDHLRELTEAFLSDRTPVGLITNLFIVAFLAALGEELFFRGVLQSSLSSLFSNPHVAVWVTAIIFSAVHMQFFGFIPRMLLGALLGYVFIWSGSLWIPILVHFVNNGLAVVLSYFYHPDELKEMESVGTSVTDIALISGSIVITVGILIWMRKNTVSEKLNVFRGAAGAES